MGKVLGERWKALNPKQREPYEAKAKTDKERYETEKATYAVCYLTFYENRLYSLQLTGDLIKGWWRRRRG